MFEYNDVILKCMTERLNTERKKNARREMWFSMWTVVLYNILGVNLTVSL